MRFTASKAHLRKACGYWLRADVVLVDREPTPSSIEGTRVHDLIEHDIFDLVDVRSDDDVDPAVRTARRYIRSYVGERPYSKEDALGMDSGGNVRHLGRGRECYASLPDGSLVVAGTADLIAYLGDGEWLVTDWKNGERGCEKAEEQLRLLAALQCIYAGAKRVRMHAVWLQGDGTPVDYGTLTRMEARGILAEAMADRSSPAPTKGDHCSGHYCPLDGLCPAFQESAQLIPASSLVRERNPLTLPIVDAEMAVSAIQLFDDVEALLKAKREELRAFVTKNGGSLDLGNGQKWGPVSCKGRESFDKDGAIKLLERLNAPAEEIAELVKLGTAFKQWRVTGKKEK